MLTRRFAIGGALLLVGLMVLAVRPVLAEENDSGAADDPDANTPAVIRVRVPVNAELWFEGKKTTSTGIVRRFETPPLTPGEEYSYEIRARWKWGDLVMTQKRTIAVHAGDRINVTFPAHAVAAAAE